MTLHDRERQRSILLDCLREAEEIAASGTILELRYRWTKSDLREKQLLKQAH